LRFIDYLKERFKKEFCDGTFLTEYRFNACFTPNQKKECPGVIIEARMEKREPSIGFAGIHEFRVHDLVLKVQSVVYESDKYHNTDVAFNKMKDLFTKRSIEKEKPCTSTKLP